MTLLDTRTIPFLSLANLHVVIETVEKEYNNSENPGTLTGKLKEIIEECLEKDFMEARFRTAVALEKRKIKESIASFKKSKSGMKLQPRQLDTEIREIVENLTGWSQPYKSYKWTANFTPPKSSVFTPMEIMVLYYNLTSENHFFLGRQVKNSIAFVNGKLSDAFYMIETSTMLGKKSYVNALKMLDYAQAIPYYVAASVLNQSVKDIENLPIAWLIETAEIEWTLQN